MTETKVENGSLTLTFNEAVSGVDDGGIVEGFAIAGKDRKFHPANAAHLVTGKDDRNRDKKDQKSLVLSSAMVSKPIHFRYAWGRNPMGNLQAHHNTDIPVATQRSDTWPLEEIYLDDPEKLERLEGRQLKAALRTEDQKRHRKEAESILENKEG